MDPKQATKALSALANEHRLAVFRLLMREGPEGLAAGDIAQKLGIAPSSLSFHLGQLDGAELIRAWRRQRHIFYAVNVEGTRRVLSFLTQDCCQGHPELCGELAAPNALCDDRNEGGSP